MPLKRLTYTEFDGDPRFWELEPIEFGKVNLLVGRNSTGKSRVLSVANSICRIISGAQQKPFKSGKFVAEIELDGRQFSYLINFDNDAVIEESLTVDNKLVLARDDSGKGRAYFALEGKDIEFALNRDAIAIQNKNDRLQHPFVHDLAQWAAGAALYNFGSDFGKGRLFQYQDTGVSAPSFPTTWDDVNNVVGAYMHAFERFGLDFDLAIIADMTRLGYKLDEVAAEPLPSAGLGIPNNLVGLVVVESDLKALRNSQLSLSQGMYRALALIIHLNLVIFSKEKGLVLIDDIGEGLDYERSSEIIDLIISKAEDNNIQVLMTSNDRFVMNRVPLDYWAILDRTGRTVRAYTARNRPVEFEQFKFIGLSNFDFFTDFPLSKDKSE